MTSVRPKSPPNPPRSPKISSPQVSTTEVGNRWSSSLRTPRATIEEENTGDGGSAEVDDLLPDRGGIDLPTDTFTMMVRVQLRPSCKSSPGTLK